MTLVRRDMNKERDRIGFIIPTIYSTGWARKALPLFIRTARHNNKNFFIFPGGRLNSSVEILRNPIYSLVNNDNLDGLISWSSTIKYEKDDETFERFHADFDPLPYVTLEYKIPGHININFDSYTGMKQLVAHCIKEHGAKKIAFIRGQDLPTHNARLRAYEDALEEAGLPFDRNGPLVTKSFIDEDGDLAAAQLFEDRKLIPGKDFDTLIGSNDHLIFKAINYFKKKGYYVLRDYRAAGFDDALESNLIDCSLSTVRAPYLEVSVEAFRILDKIISMKRNGTVDADLSQNNIVDNVILPVEPLFRESCGCRDDSRYLSAKLLFYETIQKKPDESIPSQDKIEYLTKMISGFLKLGNSETKSLLAPLIRSWFRIQDKNESRVLLQLALDDFFSCLKKNLILFFKAYMDTEIIFRLLKEILNSGFISRDLFERLEPAISRTIIMLRERFVAQAQYKMENLNTILNSFKCELLGIKDRNTLVECLAGYLPKIGINAAGLALYVDNSTSLWVGSFSMSGVSPIKEQVFPSRLLFPETQKHIFSQGIFMVQRLFFEDISLGYFIHTVSINDGAVYEDIRNTVSYALKNIFHFEELLKAQQKVLESMERSRELTIQKEKIQAASEAKSDFLAIMSHEIRTPLNAILGIAEIQLQNNSMPLAIREAIVRIYGSGDLLLSIINDILDLSKIESGRFELSESRYDVASLIHDTIKLNVTRYENKPIEFTLNVAENIPAVLTGDELRVKQILNNLLSNAFKYTNEGRIELFLSCEPHKESSSVYIIFRISDTGQGMTEEQVKTLGEKFSRFNMEANRRTEGTGLGMNITKNLIQLMKGKIIVKSVPGEGTVVTARLPQKRAENGLISKEVAENLVRLNLKSATKIRNAQITQEFMPYGRALVVDDVETNLYVARGLLAPYGISVDTALSGFEAIDRIRDGDEYDIIFMDHMMPRMDGIETAARIRAIGYERPIVALTANAIAGQAEMFLKNGFIDFISKPIDIRQLNAVLNKLIRDKQTPEVLDEARRRMNNQPADSRDMAIDPKLAEFFARDAGKALEFLNSVYRNKIRRNDDIEAFVINAHSMKSALANVGESELSNKAAELEQAGRDQNTNLILSSLPGFIESLSHVMEKLKPPDARAGDDDNDDAANRPYLVEKLLLVQKACDSYDKKAAKAALADLERKPWSRATRNGLNRVSERLLHSEFDEITAIIKEMISN